MVTICASLQYQLFYFIALYWVSETFDTLNKFWSNKQAKLTTLLKKLLENWELVLNLLYLFCPSVNNVFMEQNFAGRNFCPFTDKRQDLLIQISTKKDSHKKVNTYVKHFWLFLFKKITLADNFFLFKLVVVVSMLTFSKKSNVRNEF